MRGVVVAGWFLALALAVAGPLLGRGYVLLLDHPGGPAFPHVNLAPLPSAGDVGNALPLVSLLALLRRVDEYLPEKLLLLAPIVLAGLGMYRLLGRTFALAPGAAVFGGTLFALNPFVHDRLLAGHLALVLAYSLLPWLVPIALETSKRGAAARGAALGAATAGLAAVSVHVAGAYALLVVVAALVLWRPWRAALTSIAAAGATAVLLSAWWLVPALAAGAGYSVTAADLAMFAARPRGLEAIPALAALGGFWRDEFAPATPHPALMATWVAVLAAAGVGASLLARRGFALAVSAALGVALAATTAIAPMRDAFGWTAERLPLVAAYREPQKLLVLTALAYAILAGVGVDAVARRLGRRLIPVVAVALVVASSGAMVWGFGGRVSLSEYPRSWREAGRLVEGDGRTLVLPWRLYATWSFAGNRIVANPAPSFFGFDETLVADVEAQSVDPFAAYVRQLLRRRDLRELGASIAPLGVRHVALLREADWRGYRRFLQRQLDLRLLYDGGEIVVYENRSWRGSTLRLDAIEPREPLGGEPTRQLAAGPPLVARASIAPGGRFVAIARRCTDGWRLGEADAICHLGAVAAFASPPRREPLWRPLDNVRLAAGAVTAVTLLLLAAAGSRGASPWPRLRRTRRTRRTS